MKAHEPGRPADTPAAGPGAAALPHIHERDAAIERARPPQAGPTMLHDADAHARQRDATQIAPSERVFRSTGSGQ